MRVLVLGGAGAMARVTVRDLLKGSAVEAVGVADFHPGRLRAADDAFGTDRVESLQVDVRDAPRLRKALAGWDIAINATWYELNPIVMDAAIAAGVHYVDLGGLYHVTLKQLARDKEATDAGVTCLIGMGSTPGTMNVMAAHAAAKLDRIDAIRLRSAGVVVSGGSPGAFVAPYSIRTILDEFTLDVPVWRDGRIAMVPPLSVRETFEMPAPVGRIEGYATIHSELATLPQSLGKGVRNADFFVGFPPDFAQLLVSLVRLGFASRKPLRIGDRDVVPYDVAAALIDAAPKPAEPILDVDVQRCEVTGLRGGKRATLTYDCVDRPNLEWRIDGGTVGTGTPPSIAAQWIGSGKVQARGVVPPERAIDPEPYFRELGASGRTIEVWERGAKDRLLSREG